MDLAQTPPPQHLGCKRNNTMASVNKVILVGNLGRDPEMRTFPSGDQVANVTIATTATWRDKTSGENREATEWHRVVFNGRLAEIAGQYLRKGSQVYVEGSIRTRKWTDPQSGQDRYATEIRADTLQMLGGRSQQQGDGGNSGYGSNEGYGNSNYAAPQRQPQAAAQYQPPQQQQQQSAPRQAPPAPPPAPAAQPAAPRPSAGFDDFGDDDIPF